MPHNVHGLNWFLIRFITIIGNFFHVSASVSQVSHVLRRIKVLDIFEVGVFEFDNILPLDISELYNGIRCLVCLRKNITWHSSSNFFTRPTFISAGKKMPVSTRRSPYNYERSLICKPFTRAKPFVP